MNRLLPPDITCTRQHRGELGGMVLTYYPGCTDRVIGQLSRAVCHPAQQIHGIRWCDNADRLVQLGSAWKTESMVTPVFATPILTINWLA